MPQYPQCVRLLTECTTTDWADASSKHTLVGRPRYRLVVQYLSGELFTPADSKPTVLPPCREDTLTCAATLSAVGFGTYPA